MIVVVVCVCEVVVESVFVLEKGVVEPPPFFFFFFFCIWKNLHRWGKTAKLIMLSVYLPTWKHTRAFQKLEKAKTVEKIQYIANPDEFYNRDCG